MITTIYDNLTVELDDMRQWLQINVIDLSAESELTIENTLEDNELQRLINTAKRKVDNYIQRPPEFFIPGWEEGDPINTQDIVIPEDIEQFVFEYAARLFEKRLNGVDTHDIEGADSITFGSIDWSLIKPYKNMDFGRIKEEETTQELWY